MINRYLEPETPDDGCTRRHAIKTFAAVAGAYVAGTLPGRAGAGLPWDERRSAALLGPDGSPPVLGPRHAYGESERQSAPTLVYEPGAERLWTAWTGLTGESERVLLRPFAITDESWGSVIPISATDAAGSPIAGPSALAVVDGSVLVVWSQRSGGGWEIMVRSVDAASGQAGEIHRLAGGKDEAGVHWRPDIAAAGPEALVVWQARLTDGRFGVLGQRVGPDAVPLGGRIVIAVTAGKDCCRPAVAASPAGDCCAVVFDRQDAPGTQNVYLAIVESGTDKSTPPIPPIPPIPVSRHPASNLTPAVAFSPDGQFVWVAWHSNRHGDDGWDIPRWYRLAACRVSDMSWHEPVAPPAGRDLDRREQVQGFELVRLAIAPHGTVCVLGRPSHGFYVQPYAAGVTEAPLYRLPKDGWGGRGRLLHGVFDAAGSLWCARRDLGTNVLERIGGLDANDGPPDLKANREPGGGCVGRLAGVAERYAWPTWAGEEKSDAAAPENLNLYFGDIHGHSWQSDGMGEPEECHLRARDVLGDDFHVLTDHDYFVGKRIADGQWEEQKEIVDHYHDPGRFVTLFGQEWTTPRTTHPRGYGHFNVYTADRRIPLLDHRDPRYRTLAGLYAKVREHDGLAVPHHIGWTGIRWSELDLEVTPCVEVCSVHGVFEYEGNEPIRHRGGIKGSFLRDGLAAGRRVGVVGGSDQHGLIWHHGVCWKRNAYRAGLTGVWAPELSRAAILDAIRKRRTFATTGVKLDLRFTIDGQLMGGEVRTNMPPVASVDVGIPVAEGKLAWLDIIRDGAVVHRYGGEGQHSRYTFTDEAPRNRPVSYYYLRVTLEDNNMAWSSPIWVLRT